MVGVVVFAISGALTASRKQLDLGGFALIATVTAIGGGTLRDLLTGTRPVFWIVEPVYPVICATVAVAIFFTAPLFESRLRALLWADALGLALFCVTGSENALHQGVPPVAAIIMGVITATFGGIVRDVFCNEVPLILRREIYATAALAGAGIYVALRGLDADRLWASLIAFSICFLIRAVAISRGLSLPIYDKRRSRSYEEAVALKDADKLER